MAVTPVIDDDCFPKSDAGIPIPARRMEAAGLSLQISNLDRADPPKPWKTGGVPRTAAFNRNVLRISAAARMPAISVKCDVGGFGVATTSILWRLQTLQVLGRYEKKPGTDPKRPHYGARLVRLEDEWTGSASSTSFTLFDSADHNVSYDNLDGRVAGGNALLTVTARPPGSADWLVDYVHLRILGDQPTEADVRQRVAALTADRDSNLKHMLNAVFAQEAGFQQFATARRTGDLYKGVAFNWPPDPAWFPVAAFDFGVGMSQFTHPASLTTAVAWNWTENMTAGINVFLDGMRRSFGKGMGWRDWALKGWSAYNGSAEYGRKLLEGADGRMVQPVAVPRGFDAARFTRPLPPAPAASPPKWPVPFVPRVMEGHDDVLEAAERDLTDMVSAAASAHSMTPELAAWVWPKLEVEVGSYDAGRESPLLPGLDRDRLHALVSKLPPEARQRSVRRAFLAAYAGRSSPAAAATPPRTPAGPPDLAAEWHALSPVVQRAVDGGFAAWPKLRDRMFKLFGAPNDADAAIPKINAYYARLMSSAFPRPSLSLSVHPELQQRLSRAAALLSEKGHSRALAAIKAVGGFNIRLNVNDSSNLSMHSFGWAIDLDPYSNPNVRRSSLPTAIVQMLTGLDLFGAENTRLRKPAPFDAMLPDATAFRVANNVFVAAMKSVASFEAALANALTARYGTSLDGPGLKHVYDLASRGLRAEVEAALLAAGAPRPRARATAAVVCDAAALQIAACRPGVQPTVTASAATVARFGFCNMPAELIASLVASDGGGLFWLGAATGMKDFMHYELFKADQPSLG